VRNGNRGCFHTPMSLLSTTRPLEEGSGINLTPLLDMLFLLIVFFIVSSVFVEEEKDMEVQLPVSVQAEALTAPQPIVINIRQDGTLIHHGRTLTPDELERELKAAFEQQPGRSVILRADGRLITREVVRVMDLVKDAGFVKFTLKCRE